MHGLPQPCFLQLSHYFLGVIVLQEAPSIGPNGHPDDECQEEPQQLVSFLYINNRKQGPCALCSFRDRPQSKWVKCRGGFVGWKSQISTWVILDDSGSWSPKIKKQHTPNPLCSFSSCMWSSRFWFTSTLQISDHHPLQELSVLISGWGLIVTRRRMGWRNSWRTA